MTFKLAFTLLLGAFAAVNATKDDEYYRAGMGNPNVELKMYWADAHNVLQDLSQFSYLYIQYHNCAWSQKRDIYTEQESGSGDENDYWYMGATPTYAANVAFSLYGSLQGESFSGCNEDTFINSFTTTQGFESFASSLYYAGASATDYSQSYSSECQGGYGVGCDSQIGFASVSYSTDICDPAYANGVTDSMGYMNSAFQSAQCVKIYDSATDYVSSSSNYYNNRDLKVQESKKQGEQDSKNKSGDSDSDSSKTEHTDEEDRNLQNNYEYSYGYNGNNGNNAYNGNYGNYGYNSNYYTYSGTALSILYYSNACFIQNYWDPDGGCPDPFGRLQYYQENFNKGIRRSMKVDTYVTYRANMESGKKKVKIGAFLFMTAMIMFLTEQIMAFRATKRGRRVTTSDSLMKTKSKSTNRSVVELVSSTGGKIKKSAAQKMKKAVAKVSKIKTSCTDIENDEIEGSKSSGYNTLAEDQTKIARAASAS
mmetsp:Transcript_24909/g.54653  ORF Transcript_24909/g.54653 Transcript_24909/m.54653 type:complete len:481 (+) Transcript_24909:108-1550(+)